MDQIVTNSVNLKEKLGSNKYDKHELISISKLRMSLRDTDINSGDVHLAT